MEFSKFMDIASSIVGRRNRSHPEELPDHAG